MTENLLEQMPLAATRRELDQEPAVVARVIATLAGEMTCLAKQMESRRTKQILVIGSGDSYFIGLAARLAFQTCAQIHITVLQALEFACYGHPNVDEHSAIFIISSSGRKSVIWDALERAATTPALIVGITDNAEPSNPIPQKAHVTLLPRSQKAGYPTQTTAAALTLLLMLAVEWGSIMDSISQPSCNELKHQIKLLPEKMNSVLENSHNFAKQIAAETCEQNVFTLIGSGPNEASAHIGSALLAEGPQRFGLALPLEEFHHSLRQYALQPGNPVILIATQPVCLQRSLDTARATRAQNAFLAGIISEQTRDIGDYCHHHLTIPEAPEILSPLLTLIPLQELSIQLAEKRISQGYNRPYQ